MNRDPIEIDVPGEVIEAFDRIAAVPDANVAELLRAGGVSTAEDLLALLGEAPPRQRERLVAALLGQEAAERDSAELGYFRWEIERATGCVQGVGNVFERLLEFASYIPQHKRAAFVDDLEGGLRTAQYGVARYLAMALVRVSRMAHLPRAYTAFFASALDAGEARLPSLFDRMTRIRNRLAPNAASTVLFYPKSGTNAVSLEPIVGSLREFLASERVANDVDLVPQQLRGVGVSFWQSIEVWLPVDEIAESPAPAVVFAMVRWVHQVHEEAPRRPISVTFMNLEGIALAQIKWESGEDSPTYTLLNPSARVGRRPGLDE